MHCTTAGSVCGLSTLDQADCSLYREFRQTPLNKQPKSKCAFTSYCGFQMHKKENSGAGFSPTLLMFSGDSETYWVQLAGAVSELGFEKR